MLNKSTLRLKLQAALMPDRQQPDLRIYRQARLRTTAAAAVILLIPFAVFCFLLRERLWAFSPNLQHPMRDYLLVCFSLGAILAIAFGRYVSSHILTLVAELQRQKRALAQREHERDEIVNHPEHQERRDHSFRRRRGRRLEHRHLEGAETAGRI